MVVPLLVTIPILCAIFLFLLANRAVQSPCAFLSADLLFCGLGKTIVQGIAATWGGTSVFSTFTVGAGIGGIGQSALALNRFMEASTVLCQGVSSLTWKVGVLGADSGCGGLQLGAEGFSSNLWPSCWGGNSFEFSLC